MGLSGCLVTSQDYLFSVGCSLHLAILVSCLLGEWSACRCLSLLIQFLLSKIIEPANARLKLVPSPRIIPTSLPDGCLILHRARGTAAARSTLPTFSNHPTSPSCPSSLHCGVWEDPGHQLPAVPVGGPHQHPPLYEGLQGVVSPL